MMMLTFPEDSFNIQEVFDPLSYPQRSVEEFCI